MSAAKQTGRFLQFPLALLAYGKTDHDKLNAIIAYAVITSGKGAVANMGGEDMANNVAINKIENEDFNYEDPNHLAWAFGKDIIGIVGDSPMLCVDLYRKCAPFLGSFGASPLVRVNPSLIFQTQKGEFDFQHLQVLLSLYAIIGNKLYVRVLRDRVRAGALGYSSNRALFDGAGNLTDNGRQLLAKRDDKAMPLTINQVRYALDKLHGRKFFSRIQPKEHGRSVFYSRSLNHEELGNALLKKMAKSKPAAVAQSQAQDMFRQKAAALLKR